MQCSLNSRLQLSIESGKPTGIPLGENPNRVLRSRRLWGRRGCSLARHNDTTGHRRLETFSKWLRSGRNSEGDCGRFRRNGDPRAIRRGARYLSGLPELD